MELCIVCADINLFGGEFDDGFMTGRVLEGICDTRAHAGVWQIDPRERQGGWYVRVERGAKSFEEKGSGTTMHSTLERFRTFISKSCLVDTHHYRSVQSDFEQLQKKEQELTFTKIEYSQDGRDAK